MGGYQSVTFLQPWNYVDGRRCDPVDHKGLAFHHHEPATGSDVCVIPESGAGDVDAAVASEILTEAGLPAGCLNVLQGQATAGELLCRHPDVAKISFTGSVATGIAVLKQSADTMKHSTMELGGKSPLIVFDDADLTNALRGVLIGNFITQGAVCSAGTRLFLQRGVYERFSQMVVDAAIKMKIGDPMEGDVKIGATINAAHARKVLTYIDNAKSAGARILCGGERVPLLAPFENGWYLSPCVFDNVGDDDVIVKEEVFGCACALLPFDTEEEAVERAN